MSDRFHKSVKRLSRRARLAFSIHMGAWPATTVSALILAWMLIFSAGHTSLALFGIFIFLLIGVGSWFSWADETTSILLELDEHLQTQDLLGASWDFDRRNLSQPMAKDTIQRAVPWIPHIDRTHPHCRPALIMSGVLVGLLVAIILLGWPLAPIETTPMVTVQETPSIVPPTPPPAPIAKARNAAQQTAQRVRSAISGISAASKIHQQGKTLAQALEDFSQGKGDAASVLAAANAFSQAVDEALENETTAEAIEKMAPELAKALELDPLTKAIAEALKKKDLDKAADILKSLLRGISDDQLRRLAEQFSDWEGPDLGLGLKKSGQGREQKSTQGEEKGGGTKQTSQKDGALAQKSTSSQEEAPGQSGDPSPKGPSEKNQENSSESVKQTEQPAAADNSKDVAKTGKEGEKSQGQETLLSVPKPSRPPSSPKLPSELLAEALKKERPSPKSSEDSPSTSEDKGPENPPKNPQMAMDALHKNLQSLQASREALQMAEQARRLDRKPHQDSQTTKEIGKAAVPDPTGDGATLEDASSILAEAQREEAHFEDAALPQAPRPGDINLREAVVEGAQIGAQSPVFVQALRIYRSITEEDMNQSRLPRALRSMVEEYFDLLEGQNLLP